ncbi:MAG TPA: hypothetical protein VFE78_08295 [Gemmataceae bacterium]|jgi:hypothetical protein|nr:hypothetical protein [Gemmataceae bacterium]
MLEAPCAGEADPEKLADLARRRPREKIPQLRLALAGRVRADQRFLLRTHLAHLGHLEELIGRLGGRVTEVLAPFAEAAERLTTIPGVSLRVAEVVLAEVGTDIGAVPDGGPTGVVGGAVLGQPRERWQAQWREDDQGDRRLRAIWLQAAWAASRTMGTYLAAQHQWLARRRGRRRALVAVAHTLAGDHLPPAEGWDDVHGARAGTAGPTGPRA